ncbi:MAG: dihydropteroate synthase [Chloroflexi bacterium]|nr:dihydropteroate synthase [Chloroflexota bacterium]
MNHRVFLGLGSNLGNRGKNLADAVQRVNQQVEVIKTSSIYETEPWGFKDQPKFFNQVVEGQTALDPAELLTFLKETEVAMGREKTFRMGPRIIDLDILFYDDLVIESGSLTIPHPALTQRAFVLIPLNEIASDLIHPKLYKPIQELVVEKELESVTLLPEWKVDRKQMPVWGERTYVMGILNLTPDSFSGDGLVAGEDLITRALAQADEFLKAGADILDLGAESSRPGSQPVPAETELERLLPVLKTLREKDLPAIISVDTWKSKVAEECLKAGANWINDIWGLKADPQMAAVIADHKAGVVLMHNRSRPASVKDLGNLGKSYEGSDYADFMGSIRSELQQSIEIARSAGIQDEKIVLDPGIGFGKSQEQNLGLINHLDELISLGFPLLVGPSRKSFIGQVLDLPVEEREEGTAAAVAVSILRGADIVRVHDIKPMVRVVRMTDAIVRS